MNFDLIGSLNYQKIMQGGYIQKKWQHLIVATQQYLPIPFVAKKNQEKIRQLIDNIIDQSNFCKLMYMI